MSEFFSCDFYFGDTVFQNIKSFDKENLRGYKGTIYARRLKLGGFIWYNNIRSIFKNEYTHYIITGEPRYIINWIVIIYAKLRRKKVLAWTHGILNESFIASKSARFLYKTFFNQVDTILLYGKRPTDKMLRLGCKKEQIAYIHNSLDTQVQSRIYEKLTPSDIYKNHFGNNNPTVIYIGRIQRRKKVDQLINAVELLRKEGRKINIVIVGSQTDDQELYSQISTYNSDRHIWLYGPCYDEHINAELLYNASVCVSPAEVGLTAIHSLTYGTPVVSNDDFETQMPEHEAIIPNVTGSFFKANDIEDLSKHIQHWINLDKDERKTVRESARNSIIKDWSIDYQINILEILLNCNYNEFFNK